MDFTLNVSRHYIIYTTNTTVTTILHACPVQAHPRHVNRFTEMKLYRRTEMEKTKSKTFFCDISGNINFIFVLNFKCFKRLRL